MPEEIAVYETAQYTALYPMDSEVAFITSRNGAKKGRIAGIQISHGYEGDDLRAVLIKPYRRAELVVRVDYSILVKHGNGVNDCHMEVVREEDIARTLDEAWNRLQNRR